MYKYPDLALGLEDAVRRVRACNELVYCLSLQTSTSAVDGGNIARMLYLLHEVMDENMDAIERKLSEKIKEEKPT